MSGTQDVMSLLVSSHTEPTESVLHKRRNKIMAKVKVRFGERQLVHDERGRARGTFNQAGVVATVTAISL